MDVQKVLKMNPGDNETSYANNSALQKLSIMKSRHVIEYGIRKTWNNHVEFPKCFRMADLACSSGPNALLGISYVIDMVEQICQKNSHQLVEFEVYLNDLPHNDFNQLFKLLSNFHENRSTGGRCFISGLPGSFYNKLFPRNSMHLISSFCGVNWLSKVPKGLEKNKGNIHLGLSSPPHVFEAYLKQFEGDFCTFLRLRAEELKHGGLMVLTIPVRTVSNPFIKDGLQVFSMIADALAEMSAEGMVEEAKIDAFNIPVYLACKEEVEAIIEREGSFELKKYEIFEVNWDGSDSNIKDDSCCLDNNEKTRIIKNCVRASTEPMLANHFGTSLIEELFARLEKNIARQVCKANLSVFQLVIALTKK